MVGSGPSRKARAKRAWFSPRVCSGAAFFVVLAQQLLAPSAAHADLRYCNHTSFYLLSAVAFDENKQWRSRGWIPLRPGDCRTIIQGDISKRTIYTYAESHPAHLGAIRTWEGRKEFCTGKERFDIVGREECANRNFETRSFSRLDSEADSADWTMEFLELRVFDLARARNAGVQRLLQDVGYRSKVDGYLGRRTKRTIQTFQRQNGLSATGDPSDDVVDKMLDKASTIQRQSGYSLCNQTGLELWSAIGYSDGKSWTSRGWWKVPPGECIKPIKDKLNIRFFYTYAEAVRSNGERIIWGGEHPLCTADVLFEIKGNEECAIRGYEETGFQRVDTQGRSGWRQEFVYEERP